MKPVNLKALARELNLSVSAVSRALNNRSDIAEDTKARVQKLAAELNYKPNAYASSLRSNKSKTIGIVIPKVDNHFFSLAINGIEEIAKENDYHVLISLTHEEYQQEVAIIKLLAGGRVDGILLSIASASQDYTHLDILKERGIPVVFFDRVYEQMPTAKVTTDDYESAYQATLHLLEAGCRTIAHLGISAHLSISQRRRQGYADALRDRGRAYDPALVLQDLTDAPETTDLIENLLADRPDIDGLFASVEVLAMSSYEACHRLNRAIPDQVRIIGFSNLEVAALLKPPLTTITQPAYAMGKEAARILFRAINQDTILSAEDSLEIRSELVVRKSA